MTREQLAAGLRTLAAFADTIRELGSIPAGHLYARVMDRLTLDQFNSIIDTLERSTVIRRNGDLLVWNVA